MAADSSPSKNTTRSTRTDGETTRAHIIEVAGRLFAQYGFEVVTSKMICTEANVNMAAVNYHFGSREGLYRSVLLDVHQRLANLQALNLLAEVPIEPRQKLELIIRAILSQMNSTDWYIRFYIREAVTANDIFIEILRQQAVPKSQALFRIFSQITGLSTEDERLPSVVLTVLAPCILPLIANRKAIDTVLAERAFESEQLIQHISQFTWAGIENTVHQI